jgi:hypothetical protein
MGADPPHSIAATISRAKTTANRAGSAATLNLAQRWTNQRNKALDLPWNVYCPRQRLKICIRRQLWRPLSSRRHWTRRLSWLCHPPSSRPPVRMIFRYSEIWAEMNSRINAANQYYFLIIVADFLYRWS